MTEVYHFGDFCLILWSPTTKRNVSPRPLPQPRGQDLQGERCAGAVLHCSPSRSRGKLHMPGREAAPFAAKATLRGLAGCRYSVSSALCMQRGEAALRRSGRDGATPPPRRFPPSHTSPHWPQPRNKGGRRPLQGDP